MHRDTLHIEVTYHVPAAKIWEALTDVSKLREWYFDVPGFAAESGVVFEFYKSGYKRDFLHRCKILEVNDGRLLKYTWSYPNISDGESVVTWELIPRGGATCLRLIHEDLRNHEQGGESFAMKRFESGWHDILQKSLANYLEKEK